MKKGKDIKPHIGIFGRRNNGKSSFINMITGQDVAIVSNNKKSNAKIWLKDGVVRSVFENNLPCYPLACEFKGTVSQII